MRNYTIFFILILLIFAGCESGTNKTITGEYFNRKPGTIKTASVPADSITIGSPFKNDIGYYGYTFAGTYKTTSAFSVFKFSRPGQSVLDSLLKTQMVLTVANSWDEGTFEFALYNTQSSWADSTVLNPSDFLDNLGAALSVSSDTASTISYIYFPVDPVELKIWDANRSFLVKSSVSGNSMVNLYSNESSYQPYIQYISKNGVTQDTTIVKSIAGNYWYDDGTESGVPVVSDPNDSGFIMKFPLPDLPGPIVTVNQAILHLKLADNVIVPTNMPIKLYKLDKEFTATDDITVDSANTIDIVLKESQSTYDIDISKYMHSWYNLKSPNYGILVKSSSVSGYPNFATLEPSDSLSIIYTTLPEVDLK